MSDSEDSPIIPSDPQIEKGLRATIGRIFKSRPEDLTIKRIRKATEDELKLPVDFFKTDSEWKDRSKDFITKEVDRLEKLKANTSSSEEEEEEEEEEKKTTAKSNGKPKPAPKQKKAESASKRGTKRAVPDAKPNARKKRKVSSEPEDDESELSEPSSAPAEDEDEVSEAESTPPPAKKKAVKPRAKPAKKDTAKTAAQKAKPGKTREPSDDEKPAPKRSRAVKKKIVESEDEDMDKASESEKAENARTDDEETASALESKAEEMEDVLQPAATMVAPKPEPAKDDASESEMSIVIDEPPKKKRQKKESSENATKPAKASKTTKKEAPEVSSDEAEIKRLQGWLVKCGIRKLWGVELKPYDTPKAKIKHLQSMLSDAGMDGRYSVDKAKAIKERRELAAELEAVEEFGARWGEEKRSSRSKKVNKKVVESDDEEDNDDEESEEEKPKGNVNRWGVDNDLLGGGDSDSD